MLDTKRLRTFLTAPRTRKMMRWTLLLSVIQMLLHLAVFPWVVAQYQELGAPIPFGHGAFFVVGIPIGIYTTLWAFAIFVVAVWPGSERYWGQAGSASNSS